MKLAEIVEQKIREIMNTQKPAEQLDTPAVTEDRRELAAQIQAEHADFREKIADASQAVERARLAWEASKAEADDALSEFARKSQSMKSIENAHDAAVERLERRLKETADPRIEEVIHALKQEIERTCNPATAPSVPMIRTEYGGLKVDAEGREQILKRLQHCREAVRQAEAMKLDVPLDLDALNRLLVGGE